MHQESFETNKLEKGWEGNGQDPPGHQTLYSGHSRASQGQEAMDKLSKQRVIVIQKDGSQPADMKTAQNYQRPNEA